MKDSKGNEIKEGDIIRHPAGFLFKVMEDGWIKGVNTNFTKQIGIEGAKMYTKIN